MVVAAAAATLPLAMMTTSVAAAPAVAAPISTSATAQPISDADSVPANRRDAVLAKDWRSSADRAVTTDGDSTGLHVLVADAKSGYAWRTAATLGEQGVDTDQWIGQSCLTGSGRRAVVVYGPRQIVNHDNTFRHGALAAIVDLDSGVVTKLPDPVSMAYYNPGCGAGETAVLTQNPDVSGKYVTRFITVDAASGKTVSKVDAVGQVTSAVPVGNEVVAAHGTDIVHVDATGKLTTAVSASAGPFRLSVDSDGGVGYELQHDGKVEVHRLVGTKDRTLAEGDVRSMRLAAVAGRVFVTGDHAGQVMKDAALPASWRAVDAPVDAEMSTEGALAVVASTTGHEAAGDTAMQGTPTGTLPVHITTKVTASKSTQRFEVRPAALRPNDGLAPSPALPGAGGKFSAKVAGDPATDTTDPNRTCAIARNDPKIQSIQESPQMAEWAADLAVKGALTVQRPAGFNGSTLPVYTPQGLFRSIPLTGGGQVPAQVLLGVMAQESNMWQASPHAVDGESSNFNQGGFYGRGVGVDSVDFGDTDCGYGATQVTTGMTVGDAVYTHDQQVALTVDYAANIAAGLQILVQKWNQMKQVGAQVNNGDPRYIENWWYALWAYNTGWHALNDPSDPKSKSDAFGLGWGNNVANEDLVPDRTGFLDNTTACTDEQKDPNGNCNDAKHPGGWSYPERIMGWARHSLVRFDYSANEWGYTFKTAQWQSTPQIPAKDEFCAPGLNQCDSSKIHKPAQYPDDSGSHCLRDDLACYWHTSATWAPDASSLGTETLSYQPGAAEPPTPRFYQSDCKTSGLPSNALIIDDVSSDVTTRTGCAKSWTNAGSLSFRFNADGSGNYPAKIDFHQLDGGFGGHFWFAHAWGSNDDPKHKITGTWTLNRALNGWARVMVYVPDHGADTPQAQYRVAGSDSSSPNRSIVEGNYFDDNHRNAAGSWQSIGAFHFNNTVPSVSLDNYNHLDMDSGKFFDDTQDIPWDAIALQPLPGKPTNQIVAMGDSFAAGEGATHSDSWDYYRSSDHDGEVPALQDACHRSAYSWSRQAVALDSAEPVGSRIDRFDPALDYHMTACSGATTTNVASLGQFNEGNQISQGYLDDSTTLVTLQIGGNDAEFTKVVTACATHFSCSATTVEGDTEPLGTAEPKRLDTITSSTVPRLIQQIHDKAPHAMIKLMGYPVLIDNLDVGNNCQLLFGSDNIKWLSELAARFDADFAKSIPALATSAHLPVTYMSPLRQFDGKAACGHPEDINEIVARRSHGDAPFSGTTLQSQQSFHPTIDGAKILADVLTVELDKG
jgi:hypothetical protein